MKRIIPLTALLLTGLLMLSGCNPTNPELPPSIPMEAGPAPTLLEVLELSEADVEGLDEMFEKPDVSDEKGGLTLRALETCGDGQALYVLLSLTLPEDADPDKKELTDFWSTSIFSAEDAGTGTEPLRYDPETRQLYVLSSLDYAAPGYAGQTVHYKMYNIASQWLSEQDPFALIWRPNNQAPKISAQNEYGTCTVTPLSMNIQLQANPEDIGAEIREGNFISDYIEIQYQDGTVVEDVTGGTGADHPITLYAMHPPLETLFHLQELDSIALFDCVFDFKVE